MLLASLGFILWMIVLISLTHPSKSLRMKLPVVPVLEGQTRGSEVSNCQACGGGIEYDAGDFACLCSYCNVENFRVRFARRERMHTERQAAQMQSVLFGAVEIIEDYIGTLFFVLIILAGASLLLTIFYAIKNQQVSRLCYDRSDEG
jgi:hypothetical protein